MPSIINPAGLTTYGEATRHALVDTKKPCVEVHVSNMTRVLAGIAATQPLESRFTMSAVGVCMGFRQYSYMGALLAVALTLDDEQFFNASAA